jgi:hypothetical protein
MLPEAGSCASQGTCSVKNKRRKQKFYYFSNKALETSRMRMANKEFSFWGPIKLLDFGNADVADFANVTDDNLWVVQEVEEEMITDINKAECATKVNVSLDPVI